MDYMDVNKIKPEPKDNMRAEGLMVMRGKSKVDKSPFRSNASKMAKLITDPFKLVRRAKAVSSLYGYGDYFPVKPGKTIDQDANVFAPFAERLEEMGFNRQQIDDIAGWKLDPLVKQRQAKMASILNKMREEGKI
jgi:hypothetical protein